MERIGAVMDGEAVPPIPFASFNEVSMSNPGKACKRRRLEIPEARVEALAETQLCVRCSKDVGGDFVGVAVAETASNIGRLKKNSGGSAIQKKRREIAPLDD